MRLNLSQPEAIEKNVAGDFGEFFITVRRPTAENLGKSDGFLFRKEFAELFWFRFEFVTGWRDMEDEDGKPVPFSRQSFEAALRYPEIYSTVSSVLADVFTASTLSEDEAKNSESPPIDTSTVAK